MPYGSFIEIPILSPTYPGESAKPGIRKYILFAVYKIKNSNAHTYTSLFAIVMWIDSRGNET